MALQINAPLDIWERKILSNYRQCFGEDFPIPDRQANEKLGFVFDGWSWARKIRNELQDVLNDDADDSDKDSIVSPRRLNHGLRVLWEHICSRLSHWEDDRLEDDGYACHSRLSRLLDSQKEFEEKFATAKWTTTSSDIKISSSEEDNVFWLIVVHILDHLPSDLRGQEQGFSAERYCLFDEHWSRAIERATTSNKATSPGDVLPVAEFSTSSDIQNCLTAAQPSESDIHEEINCSGTSRGLFTREYHIWSLARMVASIHRQELRSVTREGNDAEPPRGFVFGPSLEDPTQWLEFIPLRELQGQNTIAPGCKLLWKPAKQLSFDHHLFTEEEVYKYCVENDFVFPGYKEEDSVVFIATKVDDSPLFRELNRLQKLWNDCAMTVDPTNGQWYVLETIPGRNFREVAAKMGINTARAQFRRIIDENRGVRKTRLSDILHEAYKSEELSEFGDFEGRVDAIPAAEIVACGKTPLGGHSGHVFGARWRCPQKIDMSSEEAREVVLKKIWPPDSRNESRLHRELRLTLIASVKQPSGRSVLYGLTRLPCSHPLSTLTSPNRCTKQDSIFLVFERAPRSLSEYLKEILTGTDQDWDKISFLFQDLAHSMANVHREGIVHRDIHLENIVIRKSVQRRDPYELIADELVIVDFGESRTLDTLADSYNQYGDGEFWAPELHSGSAMSMESDMYAIGLLMEKVLGLRYELAVDMSLGRAVMVPKPLLNAADRCQCQGQAARERLSADGLEKLLGEIISAHFRSLNDAPGEVSFEESEFVELRSRNSDSSQTDEGTDEGSDYSEA